VNAEGVPGIDDGLVSRLVEFADDEGRAEFIAQHPELQNATTVEHLTHGVVQEVRVDRKRALRMARSALILSDILRDERSMAQSLRATANALYAAGQNREAVEHHAKAISLFDSLNDEVEVARTLSSSLQPRTLVGDYAGAMRAADRAREIFTRHRDEMRLARLDINVGNILHRQDRFADAIATYQRAYRQLLPFGDPEGIAVLLHNIAVCQISLNEFRSALETYQQARDYAERHRMPLLVAQADYNIAWLYYQRGEYTRAIDILHACREACRENGDRYHFALCHMDLSEIHLELNLSEDAAQTAQEGFALFEQLGMGYEAAKCTANLAIALGQEGKTFRALELFAQARERFVREQNLVWPSLIDLYEALLLYNEGRYPEAQRLCAGASSFFEDSPLRGKAILARLLMSRLRLRMRDLKGAGEECAAAIRLLEGMEAPVLRYQAHFLMGQIHAAAGQQKSAKHEVQHGLAAYASYQTARQALEELRSRLGGEELKISFMKNKLEVYESLVDLCLARGNDRASLEEAFVYIEQSKSRTLMDVLFQTVHAAPDDRGQSDLVRQIRGLREELNWYYHRCDIEQLRHGERSPGRLDELRSAANRCEKELLRALRELPASEQRSAGFERPATVDLAAIRRTLPENAVLLEYFRVRDRFLAMLLTRDSLQIIPVTLVSRVGNLLRMLQFQLSKFRLGAEYIAEFQESLLVPAQAHLHELYKELVEPIRDRLLGEHLIVVPHHVLHYIPFHALFDGEQYLADAFTISYAPSASVYAMCAESKVQEEGGAMVLGVPDAQAPFIEDEVRAVAEVVPGASLYLGEQATQSVLASQGAESRLIHIATHGFFRKDNPMFSGIRLGDFYLSLYDLYQMDLPADLVVLSGCATGLNVVAAGDELLGLVRGLICAGARSLVLSLWDVQDKSTAEFMRSFYRHYAVSGSKSKALQATMREMRQRYPHPYYWAPFILVGRPN
jgi:CHAT domain-containing protein